MKTKLLGTLFLAASILCCTDKTALAEPEDYYKPNDVAVRHDLTEGLKFCTGVNIWNVQFLSQNPYDKPRYRVYVNGVIDVISPTVKQPVPNQIAKELFASSCFNQVGVKDFELDLKAKIIQSINASSKHTGRDMFVKGGLLDIAFTLQYKITSEGYYILEAIY